jgi:hypothetical protein
LHLWEKRDCPMAFFLTLSACKKRFMTIMAIRDVEFSNGDTKSKMFLPKNQHTQKKLLNFGLMASCQKVPKFDVQSQFSVPKIIQISHFFFIEEANFFVVDFFDKINFEIPLFRK